MSSIFLSHTYKDKPFVRRLAAMLKAEGVSVWIDEAEIGIGESLLQKIDAGIDGAGFVGVVISAGFFESNWGKKELEIAMADEIDSGKLKVLPIVYEKCPLPGYLRTKLYADFTDEKNFHHAFDRLLCAIKEQRQPRFLSAREIMIELKTKIHGAGYLVGLSQQGINQQYLLLDHGKTWNSADAKSGRSRNWIAEFFNPQTLQYNSFGIRDGIMTELPTLELSEETKSKIHTINSLFVDSVEIIRHAVDLFIQQNKSQTSFKDFIVLTRMFFHKKLDRFVWLIMFYDIVQVECIFAINYSAETGTLLDIPATNLDDPQNHPMDHYTIARQWVDELAQTAPYKNLEADVLEQIANDFANKIDTLLTMTIIDKLAELGKLDDYEAIPVDDQAASWRFVEETIPDLEYFIAHALIDAKRKIVPGKPNLPPTTQSMNQSNLMSIYDYSRKWATDLVNESPPEEAMDTETVEAAIKMLAGKLENRVLEDLIDKLDEMDKLVEFGEVSQGDQKASWKFISDTIPDFQTFLSRSIIKAKKTVLDEINNS